MLMPLLDHFHPPLSHQPHGESFHTTWASALADALNEDWLPAGYFAEEPVTAGGRVEIDVATFSASAAAAETTGSVAVLPMPARTWTVPQPTLTIPLESLDEFTVRIFDPSAAR